MNTYWSGVQELLFSLTGYQGVQMSVSVRTRMASCFTHPYWLVVVSLAGACVAIEYALAYKSNSHDMRLSVMAAIAIGLPAVLYTKHLVRRHIAFYAEYSFVIDRVARVVFWRQNWRNLSANLPLSLAVVAIVLMAHYLRVEWMPMLGMMLILCPLLYPEQEEIHRRIRERISDMVCDE